jgi:hypothetical protein
LRTKAAFTLLAGTHLLVLVSCSVLVDLSPLDEGCGAEQKLCDSECVATDPDNGCAREGCQPCALPHATPVCANEGTCAIAACIGNYENCDGKPENGCEINLDTDLEHCGDCDARPCEVENAEPACGSGSCAIRRCLPGFNDCDRRSSNGCEIDTTSNRLHCGACFMPCNAGDECADGVCVTP